MSNSVNLMRMNEEGLTDNLSICHPVFALENEAIELANLSRERAFAIDQVNIGNELGEYIVTTLMEEFYKRVYADPDDWFRYDILI